ncbi:MAG: hypothetical protein H6Q89_4083, partial [Myxococcaceae bacterium]|nr:hypothetical protein [Myxococcaceae bacterium]
YAGAPQNALVRVDLATGMSTSFPAFSGSFFQTNERFIAKSTAAGAFDAQLITATTASTVFNNMLVLNGLAPATYSGTSASNLVWAYNCAAACNVQVLGPTASNSSQVTATVPAAPSYIFGSVPPNATSTVHFTAPGIQAGGWLSPTRFMAFGTGPTKRVDLKNGVPTSDVDVTIDFAAQSPAMLPPGVIWVKASTMKRMAAVYDSTDLAPDTLGITGNYNFNLVGSRSSVTNSSLGKFAAFSDGANVFVLDGVKSEARKVGVGLVPSPSGPFVPTDRMKIQRLGGIELQYFESGRIASLSEPGHSIFSSGIVSLPKGGTAAAALKDSEPTNVLYLTNVP